MIAAPFDSDFADWLVTYLNTYGSVDGWPEAEDNRKGGCGDSLESRKCRLCGRHVSLSGFTCTKCLDKVGRRVRKEMRKEVSQ